MTIKMVKATWQEKVTVGETLKGVKKVAAVQERERERSLMCTVALVNTKKQGDSDGWRAEW